MISRPSKLRILVSSIVLASGLGLAGCAAGEQPNQEVENLSEEEQFEAWEKDMNECLKSEGVDPEKFGFGGGTGDVGSGEEPSEAEIEQLTAAFETCGEKVGDPPALPGGFEPPTEEQQLEFARCMRGLGYDFPDPNPNDVDASAWDQEFDPADIQECSEKAFPQLQPSPSE